MVTWPGPSRSVWGRKSSSLQSKLAHDLKSAKDLFLARGLRTPLQKEMSNSQATHSCRGKRLDRRSRPRRDEALPPGADRKWQEARVVVDECHHSGGADGGRTGFNTATRSKQISMQICRWTWKRRDTGQTSFPSRLAQGAWSAGRLMISSRRLDWLSEKERRLWQGFLKRSHKGPRSSPENFYLRLPLQRNYKAQFAYIKYTVWKKSLRAFMTAVGNRGGCDRHKRPKRASHSRRLQVQSR